jgi:hypothetical protein
MWLMTQEQVIGVAVLGFVAIIVLAFLYTQAAVQW